MLEHGGQLNQAVQRYTIPVENWLDLSTGINPNGWLINTPIPNSVWSQLPQNNDGLLTAAKQYYQSDSILPVAGSQAGIQTLPTLRPHSRVGVLSPSYAEHAEAWIKMGHSVIQLTPSSIDKQIERLDVLIIINPNNPTGEFFTPQQLLRWHENLASRGGWLIVDEAFMDITTEQSLSPLCPKSGLIVLRSIGKFFGLAGLRVGFVLAEAPLLTRLAEHLGPWPIATASRFITQYALADHDWQQRNRQQLQAQGETLHSLLEKSGLKPQGSCSLFRWVQTSSAEQIHQHLAKQGILTRLFSEPNSLRFGLAKTHDDWQRLHGALNSLKILVQT